MEGPTRVTVWHDRLRWMLLIVILALFGTALLTGIRIGTYPDFTEGLETGTITEVTVMDAPEGSTPQVQHVQWREGNSNRMLTVAIESDDDVLPPPGVDAVVATDVESLLGQIAPQVSVTSIDDAPSTITILNRAVPAWYGGAGGAIVLFSIGTIILGPQPWWATKWAWFWLVANPVGLVAYLALSGPTPGVPDPNPERGRLTGGWAFIASMVLIGIVGGLT